MLLLILICLSILLSFSVTAGKVTIEKKDSLIRNDLFNEKSARVEEASAYSLLMVPRHEARANVLKNGHPPKQRKNTGAKGGKA